jgi:hypothetical protein
MPLSYHDPLDPHRVPEHRNLRLNAGVGFYVVQPSFTPKNGRSRTNPLDYLPQMNERGLVLPKIHLQPLSIGALDGGFDRRAYDPACVQIHVDAVAHRVACVLLRFGCFPLVAGHLPDSIMAHSALPSGVFSACWRRVLLEREKNLPFSPLMVRQVGRP